MQGEGLGYGPKVTGIREWAWKDGLGEIMGTGKLVRSLLQGKVGVGVEDVDCIWTSRSVSKLRRKLPQKSQPEWLSPQRN
jgi:hypothetical protein